MPEHPLRQATPGLRPMGPNSASATTQYSKRGSTSRHGTHCGPCLWPYRTFVRSCLHWAVGPILQSAARSSCSTLVPRAPSSCRVRRTPLRYGGRVEPGTMGHSARDTPATWVETRRGSFGWQRVPPTSLAEFGVGAQLGEHDLDLGFAKAEVAQSGEDSREQMGPFSRAPKRRVCSVLDVLGTGVRDDHGKARSDGSRTRGKRCRRYRKVVRIRSRVQGIPVSGSRSFRVCHSLS
jgi:hypothetical protein